MKSQTPGFVHSSLRVFDLSLSEMLWSRRTIFMALVVGLPVLLSIIVRLLFELGAPTMRINQNAVTGPTIFGLMIWVFFIRFSVPVLGVFYGTSLIADEVDDKTITYLFTRPIPRGAVLIGKYLAYVACTIFVVLPSVMLVWLLIVPIGGRLGASFLDLVKDLALIALGLAVYGALFAMLGARLKRPLLVGLLFVFGWETLVMAVPGSFKSISVAYYLQGLVPHALPSDSALSLLQSIFQDSPSLAKCLTWLTIIEVVSLWLGAQAVATKEYVLEQ
jgi:ABC-2 type transport system permease protein